jgi:hypothetical protein
LTEEDSYVLGGRMPLGDAAPETEEEAIEEESAQGELK